MKKKEYLKNLENQTATLETTLLVLKRDVNVLENEFLNLRDVLGKQGYNLDDIPHYQTIMSGFTEVQAINDPAGMFFEELSSAC